MRRSRPPVVVGVTGAGENTDALRFAFSQARDLGIGVTLVHVIHQVLPPPPPSVLTTENSLAAAGARIVREARHELEDLMDGDPVEVDTAVVHGAPGPVLSGLSESASLVVLQHRDLSRAHRIVAGSTVASVAAHGHCPVVSVPPTPTHPPAPGTVTAGVHADGGPREVLEAAFAVAWRRGASLRLVHAWRMAKGYDSVVAGETRWIEEARTAITEATTDLRAKYPDVDVTVDVRHDWPADVLVEAAGESELLVLGRHRGLPGLARLGALARVVVDRSPCPVIMLPL